MFASTAPVTNTHGAQCSNIRASSWCQLALVRYSGVPSSLVRRAIIFFMNVSTKRWCVHSINS